MRHSIYPSLTLVLGAVGLAAAVTVGFAKAQEWSRWESQSQAGPTMIQNPTVGRGATAPGQNFGFAPVGAPRAPAGPSFQGTPSAQGGGNFEPQRIAVAAEGQLPVSGQSAGPYATDHAWAAAHSPAHEPDVTESSVYRQPEPPGRQGFTPSLPPVRIENPYFHQAQAQPIRQVQAIAETPAIAKPEVKPAANTAATAPAPVTQSGTSAAPATSSRRAKPFAEPPRVAEREQPTHTPAAPQVLQPAAPLQPVLTEPTTPTFETEGPLAPQPLVPETDTTTQPIAPILPNRTIKPTPLQPIHTSEESTAPLSIPNPPSVSPEQPAVAAERPETGSPASVLFTAEAPVLAVRTAGPPTIAVGKAATYAIEIANSGAADADDVTVFIDLPSWAEVASTDATSGAARFVATADAAGRLQWNIYQLSASKREQLTLKIIPRQSRPIDLAVHWTYAPKSRSTQIEVQEPKLELVLAGPQDVHYGETKTYTITLTNPGTGAAENVTLELLPVTQEQASGGTSQIGTIEAGGRRSIEIELTARQAGDLQLRAHAFGDGGLRCEAAQAIHVRRGALEVTTAGPPMKYAGTQAVYQMRVVNAGDAAVNNVTASAVLPRGATFVSASEGGAVLQDSSRVQWALGPMRPGAARVLELRCTLAEAGSNRLDFVASGSDDLSVAAQCITRVEALADLKLQINDPPGPVAANEPVVYEVTLMNRGTKAAERVQIYANFSDGIEPMSIEGAVGTLHVGQVAFQPIERIAAGQHVTVKITAKAQIAGNHTFGVQVNCAEPQTQLSAQETTQYYDNGNTASAPTGVSNGSTLPPAEAVLPPRFDNRR